MNNNKSAVRGSSAPEENRLKPGFGSFSVWAFSIGTSIGWGSLVVTCNTYLAKAGVLGTVLGLAVGMLVILVVNRNLIYMINKSQDAGGIFTFAQKSCGHDYGFLAAWFLLITYMSVLWANITSVPLFARYFIGDAFRFGFHYSIFGYEVYLGEALLSIASIVLFGLICANFRQIIHIIMIVSAFTFVAGFTFCTVWALLRHGTSSFSYDPVFVPDSNALMQVTRIAVISPWAFIGFENIAHFSEEYTFRVSRIRRILVTSVIMSTVLYIFVTLLSVTAYPPEYASWLDYIKDMGNLSGFKAVPAFYAVNFYLGNAGVTILMLALLGAIITSLIGNTMAVSRLLYAAGRDKAAPSVLAKCNKNGNPSIAVYCVMFVSVLIPFLGRTAIGWIVDITTLGATIIYGLVSYAVYKDATKRAERLERVSGMSGLLLMLAFGIMLLLPNIFSSSAMASESYILFDLWAVLGIIYFGRLVSKDRDHKYGHSVFVWIMLLLLVLFASMMWVTKQTQSITSDSFSDIIDFFKTSDASKDGTAFLLDQQSRINSANSWYTVASFALFILSALIIMNNFHTTRIRERESSKQLSMAQQKATTDQLTGVKNRYAYSRKENELDSRIERNSVDNFAIVVCDINNLKVVNDKLGHNFGDKCICGICSMICKTFKHSPVFRIGGDEFVIVLENEDFNNRDALIKELNAIAAENEAAVGSTVAVGISEFKKDSDDSVLKVFTRADEIMYMNKTAMKKNNKPAE